MRLLYDPDFDYYENLMREYHFLSGSFIFRGTTEDKEVLLEQKLKLAL